MNEAKMEGKDLQVVFLDLANAFGSAPHRHATSRKRPGIGVTAGRAISPLAFTAATEASIRASRRAFGGTRPKDGSRLPPIGAYTDDATPLTATVPRSRRSSTKSNGNLKLAGLKIEHSKSRSLSIVKAKLSRENFRIDGEKIPSAAERPIESSGRRYDSSFSGREQATDRIAKSFLPGKPKVCRLQFGSSPRIRWPLTTYEVSASEVERPERVTSKAIRRRLGVPHRLSSVALYGKGVSELPPTSLAEELKRAKVGLELTSSSSREPAARSVPVSLKKGRWRDPREAVAHAQTALERRDAVGQAQVGRTGLGAGDRIKMRSKAKLPERRKMANGKRRRGG
ncbi:hypothetical protein Z043_124865 [Scleropages formosus]|uniref:Uncharacterized protein n=1 Tax=Scleropages formosus TaxID=113540 RepID=A0A0N8JV83_SCLFO|nr:hypothetical protein Z043_124865 [Scleropages formosus]